MKKTFCLVLLTLTLILSACRKPNTIELSSIPEKTKNNISTTTSNTKVDDKINSSYNDSQSKPKKESSSANSSSKAPINSTTVSQAVTNTFGNQQLVGTTAPKLIAVQGDCIYYPRYHDTDASKRGIFEYNKSTKTERQVSKYPGDSINVVGDYLYYRGALDYYVDNWNEPYEITKLSYKIICVNLKNATYKPLTIGGQSVACDNLVMYKDYIFYNEMSATNQLCRVSLNGTNHKILATNVDKFYIADNGKVYYLTNSGKSIFSCSIEGDNKLEVTKSEKAIQMLTGDEDCLYFTVYEKSTSTFVYNVYKINKTDSSTSVVASQSQIKSYLVTKNTLFINTNNGLISVSVSNGTTKKIADTVKSFTVYNNKLYISDSQGFYEYNFDGTGKIKL